MSEQQVEAAIGDRADHDSLNERERAVHDFATQLTTQVRVDDDVVKRLQEFLSPSQLVELTATVGLANFTNRFNEALGVELP